MATFQRPCSGFSASDLVTLQAIWPNGKHEGNADGDRFVACPPGEPNPWLVIARHRDGTYLSLELSGRVYARGRSLADLALDGCDPSDGVGMQGILLETGQRPIWGPAIGGKAGPR